MIWNCKIEKYLQNLEEQIEMNSNCISKLHQKNSDDLLSQGLIKEMKTRESMLIYAN